MCKEHLKLPLERGQTIERDVLLHEQEIRAFALMAGDHNLLHHDPAAAIEGRFSSLIASGGQTTALMSGMVATELTRIKPSLGLEVVFRFIQPVFADRRYRAICSLADIRKSRSRPGSIVTFLCSLLDSAQQEVMSGTVRSIVYGLDDVDAKV